MKYTKLSVIFGLALLCSLNVCFGEEATTTAASVAKEDAKEAVSVESETKTPGPDVGSDASSDFDIEQLLKLLDALKNQDFDEVDKALKDKNILGGDKDTAKETNTSNEADKKETDSKTKKEDSKKSSEFETEFEDEKLEL
jgi:hypothetical protein